MTFLKKLGQVLVQGIAVITGLEPLISQWFGAKGQTVTTVATTVVNDLTQIAQVVTNIEAVIQTPGAGAQKLAAATPLVLNILKTSQAFSGHTIANEPQAEAAAGDMVNAVVRFMNALKPDSIKTTGNTLPTAAPAATPVPAVTP